ncbi:heavy-metal-associated domain-containing protein [Pseudomonas sp. EL_65y_Pfl2_R95]|uniref:heavy-metal-associated domain-containing protein n=1 Tax=Pseudomonas sp. EL_65y_Pfl2_R95 TaxID=3088698 RepID=UPI0030DAFD5B
MQVFNVEGMSCGHCVKAVTQAIQSADAQAQVQVDLASAEVRVSSALEVAQLISLIQSAGYPAHAK